MNRDQIDEIVNILFRFSVLAVLGSAALLFAASACYGYGFATGKYVVKIEVNE